MQGGPVPPPRKHHQPCRRLTIVVQIFRMGARAGSVPGTLGAGLGTQQQHERILQQMPRQVRRARHEGPRQKGANGLPAMRESHRHRWHSARRGWRREGGRALGLRHFIGTRGGTALASRTGTRKASGTRARCSGPPAPRRLRGHRQGAALEFWRGPSSRGPGPGACPW